MKDVFCSLFNLSYVPCTQVSVSYRYVHYLGTCMCAGVCVCVYVCAGVCVCVYVCAGVCVCVCVRACVRVYVRACLCVNMRVCVCAQLHYRCWDVSCWQRLHRK